MTGKKKQTTKTTKNKKMLTAIEKKKRDIEIMRLEDEEERKLGEYLTEEERRLEIAFVKRRLAMLEEDSDDDNYTNRPPVAVENPMVCESSRAAEARVKSVNDLTIGNDGQLNISSLKRKRCASNKLGRVVSDDEPSEDEYEPSEDEEAFVPDARRKSTRCRSKPKRIVTDVMLYHENDKIPDRKRKPRIRKSNNIGNDLSVETTSPAEKRALEVEAMLPDNHKSFVKLMLHSHVVQGFWLGLPAKFCEDNLPLSDTKMVLVDEDGKETIAKYLSLRNGLSGGWRAFAINHHLRPGDVAVFELINKTRFKVHIIRENALGEIDGALGLLNLDAGGGPGVSVLSAPVEDQADKVNDAEGSPALLEDNVQGTSDVELGPDVVEGLSCSDELSFSDEDISVESMESLDSFEITVDGLVVDSMFPENFKEKYYKLCRRQGTVLHDQVQKGRNRNLVVGMISETTNIADAISKPSQSKDDLLAWDQTLTSFELMGVSFLRAKLKLLLAATSYSEIAAESAKLEKARLEQARVTEEIQDVEMKLQDLKNLNKINVELESQILASAEKRERVL